MPDQLAWTDAGKAELARLRGTRFTAPKDPTAAVKALVKTLGPSWKQGAAKANAEALRRAKLAAAWKPGPANIEQLAILISLLGGGDDVRPAAFGAYLVDELGIEVALRAIVATWPLIGHRDHWLTARGESDLGIMDTSTNWGKRNIAEIVGARVRGDAKLEAQAAAAIAKLWPTTPRSAKTALAYAANDWVRGAEIAKELLEHDQPHPYYPWEILPHFVRDPKLVVKLAKVSHGKATPSLLMLENLGLGVLPLLVVGLETTREKWTRTRLVEVAVNIKSIKVARLLADRINDKELVPFVRPYFAQHRDLLAKVMKEPAFEYYRDDLAKL